MSGGGAIGTMRPVPTPLRLALSRTVGWLADRRVPRPLRSPLYRAYARCTGANLDEVAHPLDAYASLSAFFVRRLAPGARPIDDDPAVLVSPVDGTAGTSGTITAGLALQVKGRPYPVHDLLAGADEGLHLEGGRYATLYLSPRDYHRIHAPESADLVDVRWVAGTRYPVNATSIRRRLVFPVNERAVLRLETPHGPLLLVCVGALNVGRIRVIGVEPGRDGVPDGGRRFARGEELARFELGSTVVLVAPRGVLAEQPLPPEGTAVRLGRPLARWAARVEAR